MPLEFGPAICWLRVNGRSIAPPELPTFALGTDAESRSRVPMARRET